jgi:hypothetical protein
MFWVFCNALGLPFLWARTTQFHISRKQPVQLASHLVLRGHSDEKYKCEQPTSLALRMAWNKEMLYHHCFSTLLWNMPSEGSKRTRRDW